MPLIPIIIALIIALGGGTATLANSAKPGDTLYPVDQLVERIQEKLTTNPAAKTELLAKFADERVAELADLEKIDPTKLTATAQQLWEQHRQNAIDGVTTSIAKVTANQDKFKERLAAETDSAKKAVLQKIIDHLNAVIAKRNARLTDLQNKTFPGRPTADLKAALEKAREDHKQEIEQIREDAKQAWENWKEENKTDDDSVSNSTPNHNDEDSDADNRPGTSPATPPSSSEQTFEMRIPRDKDGNIDWSLIDTDHDGIPDKNDPLPGWPPHTTSTNPQA